MLATMPGRSGHTRVRMWLDMFVRSSGRRHRRHRVCRDPEASGEILPMSLGTIGVEEEYQLIDAGSGAPAGRQRRWSCGRRNQRMGDVVHPGAAAHPGRGVHTGVPLAGPGRVPSCGRCGAGSTPSRPGYGCRLGAAGTHPTARWDDQEVTPSERYLAMAERVPADGAGNAHLRLPCPCRHRRRRAPDRRHEPHPALAAHASWP